MTVYAYRLLGDPRRPDGYDVYITDGERVTLEGQQFVKQGKYLANEEPGEWFATESAARAAAAEELLMIGHRLIAQAKKEAFL